MAARIVPDDRVLLANGICRQVFETVMILNVSRLVFSPAPPNFQEMPR
jgi:hypothetical protein